MKETLSIPCSTWPELALSVQMGSRDDSNIVQRNMMVCRKTSAFSFMEPIVWACRFGYFLQWSNRLAHTLHVMQKVNVPCAMPASDGDLRHVDSTKQGVVCMVHLLGTTKDMYYWLALPSSIWVLSLFDESNVFEWDVMALPLLDVKQLEKWCVSWFLWVADQGNGAHWSSGTLKSRQYVQLSIYSLNLRYRSLWLLDHINIPVNWRLVGPQPPFCKLLIRVMGPIDPRGTRTPRPYVQLSMWCRLECLLWGHRSLFMLDHMNFPGRLVPCVAPAALVVFTETSCIE